MKEKYVDLHLHTTASDGTFTPTELVVQAKKLGFSSIAITDHDTVAGLEEGFAAAKENNIELIPAIELNTDYQGTEVHVLGYYIDYQNQKILDKLASLKEGRYNRIKKIVEKLNNLGMELDFEEVADLADGAALGRPHVARLMLEKGYVQEWSQAFDQYIGRDAPAYVERTKLTPKEAIQLVKEAQGIPIIAHPALIENDDLLPELISWGAVGLEVYHTEHDEEATNRYLEFVQNRDLLMTGGSDCHGPDGKMNILIGEIKAPYSVLENLKKYKQSM